LKISAKKKKKKTDFCLGYSSRKAYWEVQKHTFISPCIIFICIKLIFIYLYLKCGVFVRHSD
jgi:hypothetical protein